MSLSIIVLCVIGVAAIGLLATTVTKFVAIAQPDEWLLYIRNGKLIKAGVGISLWRRPGDVVARFTSTMQRVSFAVSALSRERLKVDVVGFILWSVSPDNNGPFRAFQKLGVVNLNSPPADLRSSKHLLATPQHRAFQQLLGAAVQRLTATKSLEELLLRQDELVIALGKQLEELEKVMGIRVEQIQILKIRPSDDELLHHMCAEVEERVREEAASIRLETTERAQRRAIDSEDRIANEKAAARRKELDREKEIRLAKIEHDREVKVRENEIEREQALAEEARMLEVMKAMLTREEAEFASRLDRTRREAETTRDAMSAVASAEESKSQNVRDYEIARFVTEKVGDALKALPLQEAKWITVGRDSPAASIAGFIGATHELVTNGVSRRNAV